MKPISTSPNVKTQFILNPYNHKISYTYPIAETPSIALDGRVYQPDSWLIFCGHCGDVWAKRLLVSKLNDHWNIRIWPCRKCGNGSLWDAWNEPWNRSLPTALLHREMDIIKGWYDEGIRTYHQFFQYKHFRRTV